MIGLEFKEASVIEEAYAKINLFLEVLGKRHDGYHGIRSVMQTVSLHDTVNVRLSESGISMTCSTPALDCGASNLCIKAAKAFLRLRRCRRGDNPDKGHPDAGGGSAAEAPTRRRFCGR